MKGFDLRVGHGQRLRVNCGDEPIQACIDAAAPLIEIISGDDGMMDEPGDMDSMDRDDTMAPPAPRANNGAAPPPPPVPQAAGDDAVPPPPPGSNDKVQ